MCKRLRFLEGGSFRSILLAEALPDPWLVEASGDSVFRGDSLCWEHETHDPTAAVVESYSCLQQWSSPGQEELQVDEGNWVVNGHQLDTGNSEARSCKEPMNLQFAKPCPV